MTSTVLLTLALPDGTGCHRMAVQFASAFRRRGHRVVLAHGSGRKAVADPLLLHGSRGAGAAEVTVRRLEGFLRPFDPGLLSALRRTVVEERVDCLIGFQQADVKYALMTALQADLPCVIHGANRHTFWGPWPAPLVKAGIYGWLVRRGADLVVCTSDTVRREFVQRFRLPAERTRVEPNGIDARGFPRPDRASRDRVRASIGLDPDDVVLINVGRLDVQKGQDVLLRSFLPLAASCPTLKLVLVGAVPASGDRARRESFEAELRRLVDSRDLGSRVIFAGWRDDVPRLLGAADLYVHAARWEGPALCLSVLEAMAAALPVISTDCSGRPRGFDDGEHGFIVPADDVEPLREAMRRVTVMSPAERRVMGERARALVLERFDSGVLSDRFVRHVEDVVL